MKKSLSEMTLNDMREWSLWQTGRSKMIEHDPEFLKGQQEQARDSWI